MATSTGTNGWGALPDNHQEVAWGADIQKLKLYEEEFRNKVSAKLPDLPTTLMATGFKASESELISYFQDFVDLQSVKLLDDGRALITCKDQAGAALCINWLNDNVLRSPWAGAVDALMKLTPVVWDEESKQYLDKDPGEVPSDVPPTPVGRGRGGGRGGRGGGRGGRGGFRGGRGGGDFKAGGQYRRDRDDTRGGRGGYENNIERSTRSGYDDRGRSGYDDRGRSGVDDRGRAGYDDRGRSGYDDRGRSGYDDRGRSGYDDRGRSGYDPAYDDRGRSTYDDRGRSGYDDRARGPHGGDSVGGRDRRDDKRGRDHRDALGHDARIQDRDKRPRHSYRY